MCTLKSWGSQARTVPSYLILEREASLWSSELFKKILLPNTCLPICHKFLSNLKSKDGCSQKEFSDIFKAVLELSHACRHLPTVSRRDKQEAKAKAFVSFQMKYFFPSSRETRVLSGALDQRYAWMHMHTCLTYLGPVELSKHGEMAKRGIPSGDAEGSVCGSEGVLTTLAKLA